MVYIEHENHSTSDVKNMLARTPDLLSLGPAFLVAFSLFCFLLLFSFLSFLLSLRLLACPPSLCFVCFCSLCVALSGFCPCSTACQFFFLVTIWRWFSREQAPFGFRSPGPTRLLVRQRDLPTSATLEKVWSEWPETCLRGNSQTNKQTNKIDNARHCKIHVKFYSAGTVKQL